jgi:hypothetical protein
MEIEIFVLMRGYVGDVVFLFDSSGHATHLALWREIKERYPHFAKDLSPGCEMNLTGEWLDDNADIFGMTSPVFGQYNPGE